MHPDLDPLQPDSPEDRSSANDGASYLRGMNTQTTDKVAGASAGAGASEVSGDKPYAAFKERRRSLRFGCSGSVELFAEGSRLPLRGTLSDISLHGCYIEPLYRNVHHLTRQHKGDPSIGLTRIPGSHLGHGSRLLPVPWNGDVLRGNETARTGATESDCRGHSPAKSHGQGYSI